MSETYDASGIKILKGLDPVRRRPGMFTSTESPDHIVREAIDNSVDEALGGHATRIEVTLFADTSVEVTDDGRGMPTDIHPEEGVSGVELILTRLHAGGKFETDGAYAVSGGLHGVGISVANALCLRLDVAVKRGGRIHEMTCEGGEPTGPLRAAGRCAKGETGTSVRMTPDPAYFDNNRVDAARMAAMLRAKALLCAGLETVLRAEGAPERRWCFEQGLAGVVDDALKDEETLPEQALLMDAETAGCERIHAMQWTMAWIDAEAGGPSTPAESYVNLIPTPAGGSHVQGFRAGLARALRDHIEHRGLAPGAKQKPNAEDCSSGLRYILSVQAHAPQFAGQMKERLSERAIAEQCERATERTVALWLAGHTTAGDTIAEHAIEAMRRRMRLRASATRRRASAGPRLPGKLTDCAGGEWGDTELFLVEGDSAGGSARQARNRATQAVLPLRGKIKNTWEVDTAEVERSETVADIATALGVRPGAADCQGLRYAKVCILADADSDGAHIATLLIGLFARHFAAVVDAGRLYMALPPLYRIDAARKVRYALDEAERERIEREMGTGKGKVSVQRFKGLGEMDPSQLRETTLAPHSRRLLRIERTGACNEQLDMLLAKGRVRDRRAWLEDTGAERTAETPPDTQGDAHR